MVSNFVQKYATILRLILLITIVMSIISSSTQAKGVKFSLKNCSTHAFCQHHGHTHADMGSACMQNESSVISVIDGTPSIEWQVLDIDRSVKKIVIDAGHGGHDSGCVGKNAKEKDLTLQMALKVGKMIEKQYKDVEVLYTRTTDVFIPLFRRIQYANEQDADLFISIHCNFINNAKTRGTETFVMGLHRAEDNLDVAKRENASILLESNYEQNYEGYDPNSPEGHIMMSMYQNSYLDNSIAFAADVEAAFAEMGISKSRGVKQAGFAVLRRASMPAVLIEAGFLSNSDEEAFLISDEGQESVAQSILKAYSNFYNIGSSADKQPQKAVITTANTSSSVSKTSAKTIVYRVQIAAVKKDDIDMDTPELRKIGNLHIQKSNDINKYMVGDFFTKNEATQAKEKLKKIGYTGAFIVVVE